MKVWCEGVVCEDGSSVFRKIRACLPTGDWHAVEATDQQVGRERRKRGERVRRSGVDCCPRTTEGYQ